MKTKKPKVLIVDDISSNVELLGAMVSLMGVEACTASSGSQALEMAAQLSPDVILLDILMPGMDGIEVCRRLKENSATRNIPVIFVTAYGDIQRQVAAVEAGGIGFIVQPAVRGLVEASVRSALRMKQLSDEVEELMAQRANLTHMIVHDITNLLTVSLGHAAMLLSDETLPAVVRENLAAILKSSQDIRFITASLLDVEKLESGTLAISLDSVNLWELIEERAQLLTSQAKERGVRLELRKPSENVIVRADRILLSRVLDNLIFNAVKFCPDRGLVDLGVFSKDSTWTVAVTNDGPPIPPQYHERIFERFVQVEAVKATGRRGVGLGLAFCKMALEAMGGAIAVESPVAGREDGARFLFRLPLAET